MSKFHYRKRVKMSQNQMERIWNCTFFYNISLLYMQSSMANQLTHLRASNLNSTFHLSCNDRQVSIYCDLPEGWSLPILFCNQIDTCLSMWQKYSVLEIGIVEVLTYLLCRYHQVLGLLWYYNQISISLKIWFNF